MTTSHQDTTPKPIVMPIRSFVKRQSRLTAGQGRALTQLLPRYTLNFPIDWQTTFPKLAPLVLEIGFGMGHSLAQTAKQYPAVNFLGVEVHAPGVGSLLLDIERSELTNLHVFHGDIVELLPKLPAESFDKIQIFFPDPWPKARHHKRRLIQPFFINQLLPLLKPNSILHLATDWQPYADHMLMVLQQIPTLSNCATGGDFHPRPVERVLTKYEARGERLGHGVWDLLFVKDKGPM